MPKHEPATRRAAITRANAPDAPAGSPLTALDVAQAIPDPVEACVTITVIAHRHLPSQQRGRWFASALDHAATATHPARATSAAAWPLRAILSLGDPSQLDATAPSHARTMGTADVPAIPELVQRLLVTARHIEEPPRQAAALSLIGGAIAHGIAGTDGTANGELRPTLDAVLVDLRAACLAPLRSGRGNNDGQATLADWAWFVHALDPELSEHLTIDITNPVHAKRIRRRIKKHGHLPVSDRCDWPNLAMTANDAVELKPRSRRPRSGGPPRQASHPSQSVGEETPGRPIR